MGLVIPFPAARNRRKVKAVATAALDLGPLQSTRFIRQAGRSLFLEHTVANGILPRIARFDVQAFLDAVQAEMIKQTYYDQDTGDIA